MSDRTNSRPFIVFVLILLQILLGLGALGGGGALILGPDGHIIQMPLSILDHAPFSNFLIPGILLFAFVGIFPMAVAYSLWQQPAWQWPDALNPFKGLHWSWAGSLAAGVIIIIWIIVQVLMIQSAGILHYIYLGWGALLVGLTLLPNVRQYYRR